MVSGNLLRSNIDIPSGNADSMPRQQRKIMRPFRILRQYLAHHSVFSTSGHPPLRILAIGDGDIASIKLGLQIPLAWMARMLGIKYRLIYASDLPGTPTRGIDLVLIMRVCDKKSLSFAQGLKDKRIPYIYMTDDDLGLVDPETPFVADLVAMNAHDNIVAFAQSATAVVVFSEALRDKFSQYNKETHLLPASSGLLHPLKQPAPSCSHAEQRIGFAGGVLHADNLALIENVMRDLLEANPALVFETIGQQSPGLMGHPRYRHFPHGEMDDFFQLLQSRAWTIGLAPLRDTVFNAAKTDNKYRTYASVGIPGIYSDVAAFKKSVRDRETGLLADNTPQAWRVAIETLLEDASLRRSMAQASAEDAKRRFNLTTICLEYLRVFFSVLEMSGVRAR